MKIDLFGNAVVEDFEETQKVSKKSPFDYVNDIAKKTYPNSFEDYNAFLTNLSFSQRNDLVIFANEMNRYYELPEQCQFDFYYHSLPKKNLFAKWAKKVNVENLDSIKEFYDVSEKVALQYEKVLTEEQKEKIVRNIKERYGGK